MSGMSGAPDFTGHRAGRMEGHGPDAARGRHGEAHAAPGAFPWWGLLGASRPPCGLHAGQVRRRGRAGASTLNSHAFEVARHHVGQVGHVGRTTSKSKAHQRFSPPDMAFSMSGACRACRAHHQQEQGASTLFPARHGFPYVGRMSGMSGAPDFTGHHAGRMGGHGPNAARGRHGEAHAAPGGFCGLAMGRG